MASWQDLEQYRKIWWQAFPGVCVDLPALFARDMVMNHQQGIVEFSQDRLSNLVIPKMELHQTWQENDYIGYYELDPTRGGIRFWEKRREWGEVSARSSGTYKPVAGRGELNSWESVVTVTQSMRVWPVWGQEGLNAYVMIERGHYVVMAPEGENWVLRDKDLGVNLQLQLEESDTKLSFDLANMGQTVWQWTVPRQIDLVQGALMAMRRLAVDEVSWEKLIKAAAWSEQSGWPLRYKDIY